MRNSVGASFAEQHWKICVLQWVVFFHPRWVHKVSGWFSLCSCRSHKNLHAPNLHTSYFNGVCHGDFGVACSIWEIRAEISLGQNFYRLRWGPYSNLFRAEAASFCSTRGIQGHQHKRIYSIVCINEISVQMSTFVPCRFRAPCSRAKARTHARCCPRLLPISWEGFSTLSSAYRASI